MPLNNKPYMIKLIPTDDKLISVVLSGGYNVQPVPLPNSIPIDKINKAITKATGLKGPEFSITIKSFNEYNSEPSKEGYTDPRK